MVFDPDLGDVAVSGCFESGSGLPGERVNDGESDVVSGSFVFGSDVSKSYNEEFHLWCFGLSLCLYFGLWCCVVGGIFDEEGLQPFDDVRHFG